MHYTPKLHFVFLSFSSYVVSICDHITNKYCMYVYSVGRGGVSLQKKKVISVMTGGSHQRQRVTH